MRTIRPALVALLATLSVFTCGCAKKESLTAIDRQRLNHALAYFVYAQANRQIIAFPKRPPLLVFSPRISVMAARNWVINGLRQPEQLVGHSKISGHIGFAPEISAGGGWERWYIDNPKAKLADTLIQLFRDADSRWDPQNEIWRLPQVYKSDYEWARSEDRFHFFLAFYQDPFPATAIR